MNEHQDPIRVYAIRWGMWLWIALFYAALLGSSLTLFVMLIQASGEPTDVSQSALAGLIYVTLYGGSLTWIVVSASQVRPVRLLEDGIIYRQRHYRWEELEGLTAFIINRRWRTAGYRLHVEGHAVLDIFNDRRGYRQLLAILCDQLAQRQFPAFRAALAQGQSIRRGVLEVEPDALTIRQTRLPQTAIDSVWFAEAHFMVYTTQGSLIRCPLDTDPQTLLLALFVAREWLPRTYTTPDLLDLSLPVDCPALGLHLDGDGLTVTYALGHTTRYPVERLAYGYDGARLTLLVDGVEHGPLDACLALADALTIALARYWLPAYREALAAGESVTFGAVTLWDDHLTDSTSGLVIQREAVSQWRDDGRRGTVFYDHLRREMGVVPYRHVVNPALCWALMGAWGSDVQVMDEWSRF